ncbi:MAG TPA: GldG family protein [Burkholderiales bacterium]|nr:GldG family protein [Burkholderiales bacterium]
MKKYEHILYSVVGLAALFLVLVALNFLLARAPARIDLTEGDLYTLSPGTKKILSSLETPVRLKLYMTQGEAVPVPLRGFARRVEDLVGEFKQAAGSKLVVEKLDPRPDSEIEDAAQLDGVEPQQLATGESFYLGVAVTQLDRKQTLPAIVPQRERQLEYDLLRAIARVGTTGRPKIGLMAGLPVLGEKFNPFTRQATEPWVLANELRRDYEVQAVPLTAKEIDKDLQTLLVIHPRDLQKETEQALDQFVMRGGKLVVFVDPYAYFDQATQMPGMPPAPSSSTLPTLFKAWGVQMDPGKVISDVVFGSGAGQRYTPTVLSLNRTAFNRDDVVAGSIETMLYAFGGAFDVKAPEGLSVTTLVRSSPDSMLVDNADATKSGDEATRRFQPSGKPMPLALRLSGKFRSAFPEAPLKETTKDNSVVLVADVDLLADGAAVDVQEVFGRRIVVPSNGNLAFAVGLLEQLAAGDDLTSLRSRATAFRPLTVVRELEAEAQKQYFGRIQSLEEELQKTTAKMQELQKSQGPAGKSSQLMSPEQQAELERFRKTVAETRLALKEVRKNLRQDAEGLVFWTKVANIAVVPILVALAGLLVAWMRRRRTA